MITLPKRYFWRKFSIIGVKLSQYSAEKLVLLAFNDLNLSKNQSMELRTPYLFLILTTLGSFASANWNTHSASTDLYIHSNDTFSLELSDEQPNSLRGPPGSRHNLKFT